MTARRDDDVEAWIKRLRDTYEAATVYDGVCLYKYQALDDLLDDYRLHADTGTSLSEDVQT